MRGKYTVRSAHSLTRIAGKIVLVRVDYNIALQNGAVTDTERIDRTVPLIIDLLRRGARVVLLSHRGRPERRDVRYSLKPLIPYITSRLKTRIHFGSDCIGIRAENAIARARAGEVVLLENLRFYTEEESNNIIFAQQLSSLGDMYVNEAFSNSHRMHASMHAITRLLPSYAGYNVAEEVRALAPLAGIPSKPSVAIIGGAKITTKIGLLESLAKRYSHVCVGGALAHVFFLSRGHRIGSSLAEPSAISQAKRLLRMYPTKFVLPVDVRIVDSKHGGRVLTISVQSLRSFRRPFRIIDIGPRTIELFTDHCSRAKTIVWNGPLGIFEDERGAFGTREIAVRIATRSARGAYTVVGGGETVAAVKQAGVEQAYDFVSTGGGAMLEFLEYGMLPAIEPLLTHKH